jgi:hypothetical protein
VADAQRTAAPPAELKPTPAPTIPPQGELKLPQKGGVLVAKWRVLRRALEEVKAGNFGDAELAVLLYVADTVDRYTGICRRQYRTIGIETGRDRSSAIRAIKKLVEAGAVIRQVRRASGNWKVSSDLSINYEWVARMHHPDGAKLHHRTDGAPVPLSDGAPVHHNASRFLQGSPSKKGRCTAAPSASAPMRDEDRVSGEHLSRLAAAMKQPLEKREAALNALISELGKKGMQGG